MAATAARPSNTAEMRHNWKLRTIQKKYPAIFLPRSTAKNISLKFCRERIPGKLLSDLYFPATNAHPPSLIGRKALSAGVVEISL
jgi:hypothetical protein